MADPWLQIASAIFLGLMLIFLFPRAKAMLRDTPKAEAGDWASAILPLSAVVAFIALLLWLVSQ